MMHVSMEARSRVVTVPYSEAAMHAGLAGHLCTLYEEDSYCNGGILPRNKRWGCMVVLYDADGITVLRRAPMLKAEAGWVE